MTEARISGQMCYPRNLFPLLCKNYVVTEEVIAETVFKYTLYPLSITAESQNLASYELL